MGALQKLVPGKDFVLGTFSIGAEVAYLIKFVDQLGSAATPNIKIIDGISATGKKALEKVNKEMKTTFDKIRTDANNAQGLYETLWTFLGQLYNCAHHSALGIKFIYKEAQNGQNVDNAKVKTYLNFIQKALNSAKTALGTADPKTGFLGQVNDLHTAINNDISNINTNMSDMQGALTTDDKTKINLNNLTEAQAQALLDGRISDLQADASKLKTEIDWETVGQVGIGIVGGLIAVTNFWNPIGWAAAAGTVVGEIELAKDKASKQIQLADDQQDIAIDKEEEQFLGPFYMLKSYKGSLGSVQNAIEQTQKGISNIETFVQSALNDIPSFVSDLGDPDSLELDYAAVVGTPDDKGDLLNLEDAIQKLMSFPAKHVVTDKVIKAIPMKDQGAWDKALNDPKSPYYLKFIKEASGS